MQRNSRVIAAVLLLGAGSLVSACSAGDSPPEAAPPRASAVVRELPPPTTDGTTSLESALASRRSHRSFTSREPSTAQIGQLLWAAQGVTAPWGGRTAPSAGGLYPLEVYAVTRAEVWHYRPDGHRVAVWRDPSAAPRLATAVGQEAATRAPLIVVVTAVVSRTEEKYGDRAERYVLLEVGHAAQNLLLQAGALGLGAVPIGAFDEVAVVEALSLPAGELAYYVIPVGTPSPST